jgi:hypothetical protein
MNAGLRLGDNMRHKTAVLAAAIAWALPFEAQAEEKEPSAVIAIGPESEWTFPGGTMSLGPSASIEFTVVKEWLEIEIGGATLFRKAQTEWETDVLFKRPFTLSSTAELMVGAGPSWTYATNETGKTGVTFVADFMFWPWPERKFGWFFEPTYTYSLSSGHEKSLAVSVGLLIAIP